LNCLVASTGTLTVGAPVSTVALTNYYISVGVALICGAGAATCSSFTTALTC